jgi:nicotinamidase-related amidase
MLNREDAVLVVIDVQGKLAGLMHGREQLFAALAKLIRGCRALGLPVVWVEQNPAGLGPTVPEVAAEMPAGLVPVPKRSFSCCGEPRFLTALEACGRRQVLVCGIETHVCIYQTARDLAGAGYAVEVVADAVSSRRLPDREIGLRGIERAGARLTTVEMALFEMLGAAEGPVFKEIVKIVK